MTVSNLYITPADFLAWLSSTSTNTADDSVIASMIEEVSRYIDSYTARRFYPSIETHYYDIPNGRCIELGDDLLSVTTFSNGNGDAITDYILNSVNKPPYWEIKLKSGTSTVWQFASTGNQEQVISLLGVWGYHERYSNAWVQAGTLGAAMTDTTSLTATMTAGHSLATGQIWKIGSEILQGSVSSNTLTFNVRGDNGSTAATHLVDSPVYVWHPMPNVQVACQQIVNSFYKKRYGDNVSADAVVTGAGVVLSPKDIPTSALMILRPLMRIV